MSYWGYSEYVSVSQRKKQAEKKIAKLRKKYPNLSPVTIEGRKIAKNWWGVAWNKNLESYADFSNRIGRGSAYLKNGFVLDLQINKGEILGAVQGSSLYTVKIKIDPLPKKKWDKIIEKCGHKISGIESLIKGEFPQELADVFLVQKEGLFPSPKEIHMDCDCPDWADMCKHIAAVLYGVGARLDADPLLLFKLRDLEFEELLKKSTEEKMQNLLKNAKKNSKRVIKNADINGIFGI
jgi:uncharacterized Zn finger protein